jgi:proline iminopeptidase
LDHPDRVAAVVGVAGHGLHKDRIWSEVYSSLSHTEDEFVIEWEPAVHEALKASFDEWIHEPELFRLLADTAVSMTFVAAGEDIRPDWPLRQLAALVARGRFREITGVSHTSGARTLRHRPKSSPTYVQEFCSTTCAARILQGARHTV